MSNEEDPPEGTPQVAAEAPPPYSSLTVDSDGEITPHPHVLFHVWVVSGVLPVNSKCIKEQNKTLMRRPRVYFHVAAHRGSIIP